MFYQNYTHAVDAIVFVLCIVLKFLIKSTYTKKTERFKYFSFSTTILALACFSNMIYHILIERIDNINHLFIYATRDIYYICLIFILLLYNLYIKDLNSINNKKIFTFLNLLFIIFSLLEILSPITKFGFYIENNTIHENYNLQSFTIAYFTYLIILAILFIKNINMITKKIAYAVVATYLISTLIMLIQSFFKVTTFTTATFFIPLMMVIVLLHTNSYDVDLGSLDIHAFLDYCSELRKNKTKFILIQIEVKDFSTTQCPHEFKKAFHKFCDDIKYNNFSFRIAENKMIFVYEKNTYKDNIIVDKFVELYKIYHLDYKIIITENQEVFNNGYEYITFLHFIESRMDMNTYHCCDERDIFSYSNNQYIKAQLEDIAEQSNLNDPRVKVYCQPVLNLENNKFTSAEALMRLELPDIGLVYPDTFIPIAEQYQLIHTLSKIILNKTCQYIKAHSEIERISVNFSSIEIKDANFVNDITNIISSSDIPYHKIAIEITESKNFTDFKIVKEKILELKKFGLKFYLDDFGTGYSNFERIMELPIDIIKFDKSLVNLSKETQESRYMVSNFANIFEKLGYEILFEGIENNEDEILCASMKAKYLQGYKYSKPIPITQLEEFTK